MLDVCFTERSEPTLITILILIRGDGRQSFGPHATRTFLIALQASALLNITIDLQQ
jgi:hypothetical protein